MGFPVVLLEPVAAVENLVTGLAGNLTLQVLTLHMLSQVIGVLHTIVTLGTLPHLKPSLVCCWNHFLEDLSLDLRILQQAIS